jgi:hypothetical protein
MSSRDEAAGFVGMFVMLALIFGALFAKEIFHWMIGR